MIFCGPVDQLEEVAIRRLKGAKLTSSFETEIGALVLGVEWLAQNSRGGRFLVCSDSRSALAALGGGSRHSHHSLGDLVQVLRQVQGEVVFQWVPGHCGFLGNERADQEAGLATSPDVADTSEAQPRVPVSYRAAMALIRREIRDPPITHERTRMVYAERPKPFEGTRKEEVALARLRSGHSLYLAAYRHQVKQSDSPDCPRCGMEPETLHHFLCACPATRRLRSTIFGLDGPSLLSLCRDPVGVASYLRELKLL